MTVRLIPLAAERERPCGMCQGRGTVPDPERPGQFKPCPENCRTAKRQR